MCHAVFGDRPVCRKARGAPTRHAGVLSVRPRAQDAAACDRYRAGWREVRLRHLQPARTGVRTTN
ncbi:hypothetical protein BBJ41_14905 [Burkholderia stabilis]|nr:hypothetical protein BBJ41_14905 [Burkholderia stabilis]